jgi:hypothetical protein
MSDRPGLEIYSWIIVENRDTHLSDAEYRQLSKSEKTYLITCLPEWIKE